LTAEQDAHSGAHRRTYAHILGRPSSFRGDLRMTTELDMFTLPAFAAERRSEQRDGSRRSCGSALGRHTRDRSGGHGTNTDSDPDISAATQAEAFVAARIAKGRTTSRSCTTTVRRSAGPGILSTSHPGCCHPAAKSNHKLAVVHVLAREFARVRSPARMAGPRFCRQACR